MEKIIKNGKLIKYKLRSRNILGILFILPTLLFLIFFIVYPVIYNLWISFCKVNIYNNTINFIGLQNFIELFENRFFFRDLKNTFIWIVGSVFGQMGLGLILALLINQKLKYGSLVRSFLLLPYVIPAISLVLVWKWLLNGQYGAFSYILQTFNIIPHDQSPLALQSGAMTSVIFANVWRSFPFVMLIYWAALKGINETEYEAAEVDGAGTIQKFFYITLPHLKEPTLVLLILRTIWTATYFDLIWLLTGGGPAGYTEHFPIWLYKEALGLYRFGFAAAIGVVMAVFLMVLIFVYFKIWTEKENYK